MKPLHILSPTEQVALHLQAEIESGRLAGMMPGMKSLSGLLGVNHKTVDGAIRILEAKGLVQSHGTGRKRTIPPIKPSPDKAIKVNILLYDPNDSEHHHMLALRDKLTQAGHHAAFAPKSITELKMDTARIQRLCEKHPADAWIIQSGSREILEWFSQQPCPSFALYGRFRNVSIPAVGTNKTIALTDAVEQLHQLGHRRIVMLEQEEQCIPHPGPAPRAFLETLQALGIPAGRYNLPHWGKGSTNFRQCLDSLFRHTPPTALIISEAPLFIAALQHLALKGIAAPHHISMICQDPSPSFHYCSPSISHISHDFNSCIHRALEWTKHIATGKPDHHQILAKSVFVRGGTVGPAPR